MFHYCDLPLQQAWSLCGGTRRKSGRDSTGVCKCLPGIKMIHYMNLYNKTKHWQPREWNILESLSADSRRNSELPQLGCVHFPRWQEETSRFERPRSSGSTHDENSVVLRYLLHSFANVLQWFLDLLLLVSWFWFWENCLSWWSLYFPDLRIKSFPSAV